jgi:hypothetical protein
LRELEWEWECTNVVLVMNILLARLVLVAEVK